MDNGVSAWYNYDSNGNITQILENNETIYEYQYDEHNQLIKEDNNILNKTIEYTYDSWGKLISIKDGNNLEVTSTTHIGYINPYRYRGYRYDNETGYYYLQSRYYNPEWGRFINADEVIAGVGEDGRWMILLGMVTASVLIAISPVLIYSYTRKAMAKEDDKAVVDYVDSVYDTFETDPTDYKLRETRSGVIYNKNNRKKIAVEIHNRMSEKYQTQRTPEDISSEIFAHQLGADMLYPLAKHGIFKGLYIRLSEVDVDEKENRLKIFTTIEIVFGGGGI